MLPIFAAMELAARGDRMADINRAEASDPEFVDRMDQYARRATAKWDEPRNLTDWFSGK